MNPMKYSKNKGKKCAVMICTRQAVCKGLCAGHWRRRHTKSKFGDNIPLGMVVIGPTHFNWKGGVHTTSDNRTMVRVFEELSFPYRAHYRILIENLLGRKLKSEECVHHVNGDITDNKLENLQVMTRSEHMKEHARLRATRQWSQQHTCCCCCGSTEIKHKGRGLCALCYRKERYAKDNHI